MKHSISSVYLSPVLISILLFAGIEGRCQSVLEKNILIQANNMKLGSVLQLIEEKGGVRFSYNSNIVPLDSIVNLYAENVSIEEALNRLLNKKYEYKEAHNFVILRYAPLQLSLALQESFNYPAQFLIRGQVVDHVTRLPIMNASVYEKNLLQTVLTDQNGLFTLRLKNFPQTIHLTVSKENYKDINTVFLAEVIIKPPKRGINGNYVAGDLSEVERTRLGKALVTSRQKIQSINIGSFIAQAPVQASLSPGLSSHGSLSGQVVNKFSFNATGAYSAGVNGMEIGLLFNIDKLDVGWFQFGGAFNLVGGEVTGLQIAGFYNNVLDSVKAIQITLGYNRVTGAFNGFQIGGLYNNILDNFSGTQISLGHNRIRKSFEGFQVGGLSNHVRQYFKGVQVSLGYNNVRNDFNGFQSGTFNHTGNAARGTRIALAGNHTKEDAQGFELAGISNYSRSFKGLRIALIGNISSQSTKGIQVAGIFNYARKLSGFQLSLINIADSASGYNIGLLNLIKKGYHKAGITSNETIDFNLSVKTGNDKLYTILLAGMNKNNSNKLQAFGLGFGKQAQLHKRVLFNPEISSRYLYQGNWKNTNLLNRVDLSLNYQLNNWIAVSAGPALNVFYSNQTDRIEKHEFVWNKHKGFTFSNPRFKGWIGWGLGVVLF